MSTATPLGSWIEQTDRSHLSYTPGPVIEAARFAMGGIDLDPASDDIANTVVRADRILTEADDGLLHEWAGRVWCNPPFNSGGLRRFATKLCADYDAGRVTAACFLGMLCPNTWCYEITNRSRAIVMLDRRLKHWGPNPAGVGFAQHAVFLLGDADPRPFMTAGIATSVQTVMWMAKVPESDRLL